MFLRGHTLAMGGRPYDGAGRLLDGDARRVEGWVLCECGEGSPILPNASARSRWHDRHRDDRRPEVVPAALRVAWVVGRCALCGSTFNSETAMMNHYDAIRRGAGCNPPEAPMPIG